VLAAPGGDVLQAALHRECMDLARTWCPHLSGPRTAARPIRVERAGITTDGVPLAAAARSDPVFLHSWRLSSIPAR
jgi:hypothetical protein